MQVLVVRFQSTHSLRSATGGGQAESREAGVSIHALLAECDAVNKPSRKTKYVSIHALLAECDHKASCPFPACECFNPRTPCGVRLLLIGIFLSIGVVSIHALLAECDPLMRCSELLNSCFNPRTPCGVRRCCTSKKQKFMKFQSTHSLRSATRHAGHDPPDETFQSTHSLRSATLPSSFPFGRNRVSIHALLAECDSRKRSHADRPPGFNPRTPCGVRQSARKFPHTLERFQSTHSLRSATLTRFRRPTRTRFQSTHSLRSATGPDTAVCVFFMFQSTHSLRSATDLHNIDHAGYKVSIHALLAECDRFRPVQMGIPMGFNPRTPCGVRPSTNA